MFQWLRRALRVPVKLALLISLLLLPLGLLVYQFTVSSNTNIEFAKKEVQGVRYLRPLLQLREHLVEHRAAAVALARGDREPLTALQTARERADDALQALRAEDATLGAVLATGNRVATLQQRWQALRDGVETGRLEAAQVVAGHAEVLALANDLGLAIGDSSNLILDPDLDSYYLMDAALLRLPRMQEDVAAIGLDGVESLAAGISDAASRTTQGFRVARLRDDQRALERGFGVAFGTNPGLASRLNGTFRETATGLSGFLETVESRLLPTAGPAIAVGEFRVAVAGGLDRLFQFDDQVLTNLDGLLGARIGRLTAQRNQRLGLAGGLTALALLGTVLISRGINRQVRAIRDTLTQVGVGNLTARAKVISADELGSTAHGLNGMLDNIRGLMQSQEERDEIQASIMKLLNEVSSVADGDLTASAEVGADITGAIADSFNLMISELRRIIEDVQSTTAAVSRTAEEVQGATARLAQGSSGQATQITETSTVLEGLTNSIQQVAERAVAASGVAQQALDRARQGAQSVTETIEGMNGIRTQVQETAKRIKRLGESSQEIGDIVQVIGDIADRTSILALNASIQAAAAGDAGRGFMVVAEEIERLAERAAASSKNIETLVKTIQSETNEAVSAMEGTTREVVGGSTLAVSAGRSLSEIEEVSRRLATIIDGISSDARSQAQGSQEVARTMERISLISTNTAAGSLETAQSIRNLSEQANRLRTSLERFKLPGRAA